MPREGPHEGCLGPGAHPWERGWPMFRSNEVPHWLVNSKVHPDSPCSQTYAHLPVKEVVVGKHNPVKSRETENDCNKLEERKERLPEGWRAPSGPDAGVRLPHPGPLPLSPERARDGGWSLGCDLDSRPPPRKPEMREYLLGKPERVQMKSVLFSWYGLAQFPGA